MKKLLYFLMLILTGISPAGAQHSDTLYPIADVYVKTFGGGEGKNTFIKFDISPIAAHAVVSSATLEVYVAFKAANWDSDCKFMNVSSQTWVESDFETTLWGFPRTDTVQQLMGFGPAVGWTSSADIKQIFYRDYNQSNSFCTIMLKDPDDMTSVPMGGSNPAKDSNDSLMTGNIFNDYIIYPPHEFSIPANIPRFIINYGIAPFVTIQPSNVTVCEGGQATFSITATGDPTLTYQWQQNGIDIPGANSDTYTINPATLATAGNYRCIVTNIFSADTSDIAVLTVNALPVTEAGQNAVICAGMVIIIGGSPTASGGTPSYIYNWSPTAGLGNPNVANPGANPASTTTYCVTVTDAAGCSSSDCVTITVDNLTVTASATPDTICLGGCSTLSATSSGGSPQYTYIWNSLGNIVCPSATSIYVVTITDGLGCTATDNVIVTVDPCTGVSENSQQKIQFIPNPFSTDAKIITDRNMNGALLHVYDMLGNEVMQMKNISGNVIYINRKGLADGMYFYQLSEENSKIWSGKFIVN